MFVGMTAKSSDLIPPNYVFIWGLLKEEIYTIEPRTMDDVNVNIRQKTTAISTDVTKCFRQLKRRVQLYTIVGEEFHIWQDEYWSVYVPTTLAHNRWINSSVLLQSPCHATIKYLREAESVTSEKSLRVSLNEVRVQMKLILLL